MPHDASSHVTSNLPLVCKRDTGKETQVMLTLQRAQPFRQDCSAALQLNPDLGKAYRVRGIAHRKLGKYKVAKSDLAQARPW